MTATLTTPRTTPGSTSRSTSSLPRSVPVPVPSAAESLLAVLEDALSLVDDDDLDRLAARTPAGAALTSLSAIARRAAATLGADPGEDLTEGPGVVVVRDLAVAARLLARAARETGSDEGSPGDLDGDPDGTGPVQAARRAHAAFRDLMTSARR